MALTSGQVKIIKATIPVIEQHGVTVTSLFYNNMLKEHPTLNNIFNITNQVTHHQPKALGGSLLAYAKNIDNLGALDDSVARIVHKHASLYVQPDQYEIVGKHLIGAFGEVLGDAFTPEIKDAWAAAYWQLAKILIGEEQKLYQEANGWTDWRPFVVKKKVQESTEVTSFYLEPKDGKPLPKFQPGKYISVQVDVPKLGHKQCREYSLSDAPSSDYYRISVKKHSDVDPSNPKHQGHPGIISNLLHDTIKEGDEINLSHPFGDFYLANSNDTSPLVLISAGVGLTPLTSMLNHVTKSLNNKRPISWIHGAHNTAVRAFRDDLKTIDSSNPNVKTIIFNHFPNEKDVEGQDYDFKGRMNLEKVKNELHLGDENATYYICGPDSFMVDMQKKLLDMGVSPKQIKAELFGTGGVPLAS